MLNKLAAGLIAAALLTAPMIGSVATASSAAAATPVAKTKIVKIAKAHRHHLRNFRLVQCYITGAQARHVKLHTGHRLQRVACYLPAKVKVAKLHIRNTARHVAKHVKFVKQARHIKPAKVGHAG